MIKIGFCFLFFCFSSVIHSTEEQQHIPYCIGYSIPEEKMVEQIPEKTRAFAFCNPLDTSTYIYNTESDYYDGYKEAYFAVTTKKCGWDCLRHYEILANGCIPYFFNLDQCDPKTMYFLPKELIQEAMNLEGVSYPNIDFTVFNFEKYYELLNKILAHTREHLTSRKMASYLLETVKYSGEKNVLVLSQDTRPEYLRDLTLIGLKQNLGNRIVDVPKIDYIYQSFPDNVRHLYGRGMSYTKIVPDLEVDRSNIEQRIANREFDLIIYAEMHKGGLPYYTLVKQHYQPEEIAYIYCEEECSRSYCKYDLLNLFLREYYLHENAPRCIPW